METSGTKSTAFALLEPDDEDAFSEALGDEAEVTMEAPEAPDPIDLDEEDDGQVFSTLEELEAQEEVEQAGRWIEWPALKGAEFHLAHLFAARDAIQKAHDDWHAKHRRKKKPPRMPNAREQAIMFRAMWQRCIKGWRGEPLADLPFTFDNYKRLLRQRRFRTWLLDTVVAEETFTKERREEVEGNS